MYKIRFISAAEPNAEQLASFKAYAGINSGDQDGLLLSVLRDAFLKVSQNEDTTLLAGEVELSVTQRENNSPIYLYLTPNEIISVKADGAEVGYSREGKTITTAEYYEDVVIRYSTSVEVDVNAYLPKVLRYASALYDGDDAAARRALISR